MKVEILTEFKHGREKYFPGEVVVTNESTEINQAVGEFWCRAGWAKHLDGDFKTGNPSSSDVVLLVEDINQTASLVL